MHWTFGSIENKRRAVLAAIRGKRREMITLNYKYDRLRGRIVEKYGSQEEFAKVIGISSTSMSKKMKGKTGFSQKDIVKWSELLGISKPEYSEYFFT